MELKDYRKNLENTWLEIAQLKEQLYSLSSADCNVELRKRLQLEFDKKVDEACKTVVPWKRGRYEL